MSLIYFPQESASPITSTPTSAPTTPSSTVIQGPPGPVGPKVDQGPPGPTLPFVYLTFDSCTGTDTNHKVTCAVHDEIGIAEIQCDVANPAISGGDNVGECTANMGKHLQCTIPLSQRDETNYLLLFSCESPYYFKSR